MSRRPSSLKEVLYQSLRSFAFMAVSGPTLNVYRWAIPATVTVITCAFELFLPKGLALIGDKSISDYMATFFVALPGFFIAALAAVVAFSGGDLDKNMPDVTANIKAYGDIIRQNITLRIFLSYLFGYLTILSFFGFFFCIIGSLIAPNIAIAFKSMTSLEIHYSQILLRIIFIGIIAFLGSSVVSCTSLGLYFLSERVYQNLLPDETTENK